MRGRSAPLFFIRPTSAVLSTPIPPASRIRSSAPTRVDLAGGTLDIYPLFHLFDHPPTLNAAIDVYATVEVIPRRDRRIVVVSRDRGVTGRFASLRSLPDRHPLELVLRTVKFYSPPRGLEVVTDCQAPQGSGIGGSSALNIALQGALNAFTGRRYPRNRILEFAKNIETQVIGVPAGWQDYFPALYGGVLAVQPGLTGVGYRRIDLDPAELSRRFVLCYTGKPRRSGINNWQVLKKALDGNAAVIRNLTRIDRIARDMEGALRTGHLNRLGGLLDQEWRARQSLAPRISTPQMNRLLAAAKRSGALAGKVCGAGGGGCMAFWVRPGRRERVIQALENQGGEVLACRFVRRGLQVRKF
ncbi:MAG: GHMP kinase [Nitrospinaceae bacterium]|nr:GHMP kinase [Nitrospinaceae bacterium]NIR57252.1 GHMP kinase [Nitrospinaceae bacterium]NIS87700.1 GHMP kinase [Nitrospinaceae bacterium]NIT84566.1 GHMP kinase [Nitrospinaceae bacterium]NIU46752.1 GHMP kinase [Nitrospinaceae bacterium]